MRHKTATMRAALFKTAAAGAGGHSHWLTPLSTSTTRTLGDLRMVRYFIEERDLDVNTLDREGNSCLHWCAVRAAAMRLQACAHRISNDPKRLPIMKYLVCFRAVALAGAMVCRRRCHRAGAFTR